MTTTTKERKGEKRYFVYLMAYTGGPNAETRVADTLGDFPLNEGGKQGAAELVRISRIARKANGRDPDLIVARMGTKH